MLQPAQMRLVPSSGLVTLFPEPGTVGSLSDHPAGSAYRVGRERPNGCGQRRPAPHWLALVVDWIRPRIELP